jgi:CBS domain-containing protein
LSRESFRRTLRGKGNLNLRVHASKKHEGEIINIVKTTVVTMAPTTPVYDAIQMMTKEGFRRIPLTNAGTKALEGIVTATDIIDYLGGGNKFEIIREKFGGNIFKAINEPIRLIMTKRVVSISSTAKISDAIALMTSTNLGGLPVIDEHNHVRAIITERDIAILFADMLSGVTVAQLMSGNVVTALSQTTIFEAEQSMAIRGFRRLPIISEGKLAGIITAMDVIRFFGSGEVFKHLQSGTIIQVLNTPALKIASREVSTIEPSADVGEAAKIMRDKDIGAVPVVKDDKLVGIITERDFFKVIE